MAFARSGRRRSSICRISPATNWSPARTGGDLLGAGLRRQSAGRLPRRSPIGAPRLRRRADIRWVQSGFVSDFGAGRTPRNLMGFKDGTGNPATERRQGDGRGRLGGRRGAALDARRQLCRRPPRAHRARTLGSHERCVSGADVRAREAFGRAARRRRRIRSASISTRRTPTAIRSSPRIRTCGSPIR